MSDRGDRRLVSREVIIVPVEKGVLVQVFDGKVRSTVGRVAYSRLQSVHPFRSFKWSLLRVIARAEAEIASME